MPTINQLVREGRTSAVKKSTAPALNKGMNSLKRVATDTHSPQKRGVCTSVTVSYTHLRAHETGRNLVCRLLLEKKKKEKNIKKKK